MNMSSLAADSQVVASYRRRYLTLNIIASIKTTWFRRNAFSGTGEYSLPIGNNFLRTFRGWLFSLFKHMLHHVPVYSALGACVSTWKYVYTKLEARLYRCTLDRRKTASGIIVQSPDISPGANGVCIDLKVAAKWFNKEGL
jgi:hypothetical protein